MQLLNTFTYTYVTHNTDALTTYQINSRKSGVNHLMISLKNVIILWKFYE